MDYERIRNEIPAEEQQLYIDANLELRRIEKMAKLPDDEYKEMLENIRINGDDIQLEQFMQTYISISEYERIKNENEEWINEIDFKYGIERGRRTEENRVEALRKRPQLERLQRYYERNGSNIMRNVDVSSLTDEEVLRLYDEITFGIDNETLKRRLNDDVIRRTSNGSGTTTGESDPEPEIDPSPELEPELEPSDEVEKAISEFKNDCEAIKEQLNEMKRSLILDGFVDLKEATKGLTEELRELSKEGDELIALMDEAKAFDEDAVFSMSVSEIRTTIQNFKDRLKEIKEHQIDKYNARVDATNKLLEELRNTENLDVDIPENILRCNADVTDWRNIKYLDEIDYNKLVEVNKIISEINSKTQETGDTDPVVPENEEDLETEISYIETEIERIESETYYEPTEELISTLNQDIDRIVQRRKDFLTKLENSKDKISEEKYNEYLERINDAQIELAQLYNKVNPRKKIISGTTDNNEFKDLKEKLEKLKIEVDYCNCTIESLNGHLLESGIPMFIVQLDTFDGRLKDIKEEIEEKHEKGLLDDNQHKKLIEKVEEIEKTLKLARENVNRPEMIRDIDIFAFLNGKITGVEETLEELEKHVGSLEKPIKKAERGQINLKIEALETEIRKISETLENHKEEDEEKYKETKERLDNAKERLDNLCKKYRKKCPLHVVVCRSVKNFYKKHKKVCLIAAGLAALSIVMAPVLIPAIMHGNIMIASAAPGLSGFTSFVNGILGKIIGATKTPAGAWLLRSGVKLNSTLAGTSLLKGIATVGVATLPLNAAVLTPFIAPLVNKVKNLVDKMKKKEKKEKIKKESKTKKKEKTPSVPSKKKASKNVREEFNQLFTKYTKSGMTFEEFCKAENLTEKQKEVLRIYDEGVQSQMTSESENTRKGRK